MKENNKEKIAIQYLFESEPEHAWTAKDISRTLGFRGKQIKRLHELLQEMVRDGEIVQIRKGDAYTLGKQADLVTGPLRMVRNGAGNVTEKETGKTIWVESEDLGTALPYDIVTIRLYRSGGESKGKVIKIVERSPRDIVGTLMSTGKFLYVVPLNPVYRKDFYVPAANNAKPGDRVVVRFTGWENRYVAPEGEIVDVIGPADQPSLDTLVVMKQFDLPEAFPAEVIDEAEKVTQRLTRPGNREDIRNKYIITVDPATARDFDDAISLENDAQGNRVLGVHIADVSHFVRPNSALDEEARQRGTSVYLVDKVVPMLPEQLSNGVCSLRPDEDRLTFSAFMTFDASGRMIARRFAKTRIRSKLRLNYEQAMAIIVDKVPEGLAVVPSEARKILKETLNLSMQMRSRRFSMAALDLEVPEVEVVLDEHSRMTGMLVRAYDESHQLIEECMVAANEAVATELWTRGIKILARLHEPPDEEKLEELQANLAMLGFHPGNLSDPKNLAKFLKDTQEHPLRYHAHTMVLRSMKRALYSAEKIGHFGLAKDFYAHFTSPIRRYPDLVLHRQLADYLDGKGGKMPQNYLVQTAFLATEREQVADDASRQLIEIKKFRFLQQQLDEKKPIEYRAVVAKCTNYGVFIDIPDLAMGGMIHISNLSKQFVRFNPANESLSAGATVYRVGTVVKVQVATVDFNQRRADFVLVGEEVPRTDDRGQRSDARRPRAEGRGPRQEGRSRKPAAGGLSRPKGCGPRPDGRSPRADVGRTGSADNSGQQQHRGGKPRPGSGGGRRPGNDARRHPGGRRPR
ncbi:MAG TPA: ribonuclease R [Kiritimatiellia bacterium]|nr:ribonuclease R [Kiritimatiellia bacterium]HPS06502.1 ribonuclease R [Kiritimatiellia bacterium]